MTACRPDRAGLASPAATVANVTADQTQAPRLTSLSPGAGCACKLPLAKLEALFATLDGAPAMGPAAGDLLIGRDAGPRPVR